MDVDVGSDPKKRVCVCVGEDFAVACVHVYWAEVMRACVCTAARLSNCHPSCVLSVCVCELGGQKGFP